MPDRIQLRRTAGWRKPEGAIVVDRTTRWGNPYRVTGQADGFLEVADAETAVRLFRLAVLHPTIGQPNVPTPDEIRAELAGSDLACWCKPTAPCHADVLLEIANT